MLNPDFNLPAKRHPHRLKILASEAERIEAAYRRASQTSFLCFYRGIHIESKGKPRLFEEVGHLFQRKFFEDIGPKLEQLARGDTPDVPRWWLERTKKASKDADLAVIVIWVVAFAVRPFYGQIAAVDSQQAGIIRERIEHLLTHNPWLRAFVVINRNQVQSVHRQAVGSKAPMAAIDIMASDAPGAHGGTPDLLIINELTHITKWEFVETLMDNADGVPHGMVIIATNAGFFGTPAEVWRKNAMVSDRWSMHVWSRPAPWHSKETLADAKRRDQPPTRYQRLWEGKWVSGRGDAVSEEKITAAFKLTGPTPPEPGWLYLIGVDLGVTHDHSAICVLGINTPLRRIKTSYWKAWEPSPVTGEVDLIDVKDTTQLIAKQYNVISIWYDPSQAVLMSQQWKQAGLVCEEMSFSVPTNLKRMATSFTQVMDSERIWCYDDEKGRLRRDFGKFEIVEKAHGIRLEAVSDAYGHADVGTALVIALPKALEMLGGLQGLQKDDVLAPTDHSPFKQEEVDTLPDELRDIYNMGPVKPQRLEEYGWDS